MAKQGLNLSAELRQSQTLSPLQIQMIHMLESTTLEMEERVQMELDDNEALEVDYDDQSQNDSQDMGSDSGSDSSSDSGDDEDRSSDDGGDDMGDDSRNDRSDSDDYGDNYGSDDNDGGSDYDDYDEKNVDDYRSRINNYSQDDDDSKEMPLTELPSLYEHLMNQIGQKELPDDIVTLAEYAIGNIEGDGYLRRSPEQMVDDLFFQKGKQYADEDMKKAILVIQSLEPAGIGAANLQECLLLQLRRKTQTPLIKNAIAVITNSLEDLAMKHFDKIKKRHNIDDEDLQEIQQVIHKLNPRPGSGWDTNFESKSVQIIPDFIVESDGDDLVLTLNDGGIPELRISQSYYNQLEDYGKNKKNLTDDQKSKAQLIRQKLDSAKWFIDSVKQRHETLRRTMQAIINKQRDFFMDGDETKLKPMVLKDIANVTGFDISTISRVSNSKYVQTDWGVYPLKFFFSESVATDSGEEVSNKEIKSILKECIDGEDKHKPLTDDNLCDVLKEKGYSIARRTVAKYRDALGIPKANLRKIL